jgi:hypothetical protein
MNQNNKIYPIMSKPIIKIKDIALSIFFGYFSYSTVRLAKTHSICIAIFYRLLQASILTYIIGYLPN